MEFNKAVQVSILVSELQNTNETHASIIRQKKGISTDLILNCKNYNDMSPSSVVIPLEDAKRVLQMIEDYYANKQDSKQHEIDQIN